MTPQERLARLARGEDPCLVGEVKSGYVVMAEHQFLPGYCLLLASPMVGQLNDLEGHERADYLSDMAKVGDAIRRVTSCLRINYGIYGNLDPFLHTHIWPRYDWEEPHFATRPPFLIPEDIRIDPENRFDLDKHGPLQVRIRQALFSPGNL